MDSVLLLAMLSGLILALMAGPLGCLVVWQRMAYFGDSLAHAGLFGFALALWWGMPLQLGFLLSALLSAAILYFVTRKSTISADATLGLIAHGLLAIGILIVAVFIKQDIELEALLFGDILNVTVWQLVILYALLLGFSVTMWKLWKPMTLAIIHSELAILRGINVARLQQILLLLLALFVATAIPLLGTLLVTTMLIAPAVAARVISPTPGRMMLHSVIMAVASIQLGLVISYITDLPAGPILVTTSLCILFGYVTFGKKAPLFRR